MSLDDVAAQGNNLGADGEAALLPALEKLPNLKDAPEIQHLLVTNSTNIPPHRCPIPPDRLIDHVLRLLLSAHICPQTAAKRKQKQVNLLVVIGARGIQ